MADEANSIPWLWQGLDPVAWTRQWSPAMRLAPQQLQQEINPGWNFGPVFQLSTTNSSAPQTELEVLRHHSYGRQLGRIADALGALIERSAAAVKADGRVEAFVQMKNEIDALKLDAARDRVEQLGADLRKLKLDCPAEYDRLTDALRHLLEE